MRKTIILVILLLSGILLQGQDNRYSRSYPVATPDTSMTPGVIIRSDVANIQYSLGKYYQERRIAKYCEIGAILSGVGGYGVAAFSDADDIGRIMLSACIGLGVVSAIIHIDAEKWLKRSSIKLSPGSIRVYF